VSLTLIGGAEKVNAKAAVEQLEVPTRAPAKVARFYRPELDVVRFLAFAAVFLHHQLPRSTAQERDGIVLGHLGPGAKVLLAGAGNAFGFGMSLFFTLSAYLIGALLLREKERFATVNLRSFYVRRILRIWPLYFFGLGIGCAVAVFSQKRPHDLVLFAAFTLMAGNWVSMVWHMSTPLNPMMPLWSISVEEQFYLFCPVTVKHLSRRGLYIFSCSLIVFSDLTLYLLGRLHANADRTVWCNSFVQFQMFGAGLLLCLWMQSRKVSIPIWSRFVCLAGGFVCWLIACLAFGAKQIGPAISGSSLVAGYTVGAAGCLLIMIAMLDAHQRWFPKWMIWLGRVSFGLYVYHELALWSVRNVFVRFHGYEHFLLGFLTSATLTVLLAALSYRFLETPFLRIKERFEAVPSRPV
jgi:peptidoglycan/LPS O-acetylase OafA/YrhL